MDALAAAVGVVVSVVARLDEAHIAPLVACCDIKKIVKAVAAAEREDRIALYARLLKALRFAFKENGAGDARAVAHALRPLAHDDAAERLGKSVGRRRIHAPWAAAEHVAAVHAHVQARAAHAAQHGIAADASLAHEGEARQVLQVAAAVRRRHGLARALGIGVECQRLAAAVGSDDDFIEDEGRLRIALVHGAFSL